MSRFSEVHVEAPSEQASVGSSNVGSIVSGAAVANHVLTGLADLVSHLQDQSARVTDLASALERRDTRDAGTWTWEA